MHFDHQTGRLHISWSWREELGHTFLNVNYAYSDDNGRTWFNSGGQQVAESGRLIGIDSPGVAVWNVPPLHGLDNQQGQCVDAAGRPHILVWHLREGEPLLKPGERDATKSAYYHYWRGADGPGIRTSYPTRWTIPSATGQKSCPRPITT